MLESHYGRGTEVRDSPRYPEETPGGFMNETEAREFLKTHKQAVLATIRKDGRPQLSNVLVVYNQGQLEMSITETRAKYKNLVRDPRVTVLLLGDSFWQYLTVDGRATVVRGEEALPLLRAYYEQAAGHPHENWEEYDRAMREEQRVLVRISVDHMYPLSD
jgi:PPOX class probable F420-dependent enzyme